MNIQGSLQPRRGAASDSVVKSFQYDEGTRQEIACLLQPLLASTVEAERSGRTAVEVVVGQVEAAARSMLRGYFDDVSLDSRRNHYRKVSSAASKLLKLINGDELGGGSAAYLIRAFGRTDQSQDSYSFVPIFKAALAELASETARASKAKRPPLPGYKEPFAGKRDVEKTLFAQWLLFHYVIESNRRPGKSSTGPAARLLIAAVDPVIRFVRAHGVEYASPIGTGDNARTLIGDILEVTPIGENLPEI